MSDGEIVYKHHSVTRETTEKIQHTASFSALSILDGKCDYCQINVTLFLRTVL